MRCNHEGNMRDLRGPASRSCIIGHGHYGQNYTPVCSSKYYRSTFWYWDQTMSFYKKVLMESWCITICSTTCNKLQLYCKVLHLIYNVQRTISCINGLPFLSTIYNIMLLRLNRRLTRDSFHDNLQFSEMERYYDCYS